MPDAEFSVQQIFAEKLKSLREAAKLTQAELGKILGVSRGSVSFYENMDRTPDIVFVEKAARYFKVSADYLLGLSEVSPLDDDVQDIHRRTGLSLLAISRLMRLQKNKKEHESQIIGAYCGNRLDLYSKFISDTEMIGTIELYPPLINRARNDDLSESEREVFDDCEKAVRFYRFELIEAISRFFDRYFEDMDIIEVGSGENG